MKRVGVGTVLVVVGGLLAVGCGRPAAAPVDVMDQARVELAHTIDPVGEATLQSASILVAPRAIDTELETTPTPRTWGTDVDTSDADLLENPYTQKRYETSQR